MLHTVPDLAGEKKSQAWKEVALHPPLSAWPAGGWPCGSDTRRAPAAAAGHDRCLNTAEHMYFLVCIGWLYTPLAGDFGPGPEAAEEGAQLDGEFAFYASRRRLRAWPGGGGAAAEGCAAMAWSLFLYLSLTGLSK